MQSDQEAKLLRVFGQRVQDLRIERGFTQETLALASGLDRTYIGSVERGERNVSILKFHRIAEALDVGASELLRREENIG